MERPNFDLLSFMEEEDEMGDLIQPEDLLRRKKVPKWLFSDNSEWSFPPGKRSTVLDTNGSLRFILVSLANGSFDSVCKKSRSSTRSHEEYSMSSGLRNKLDMLSRTLKLVTYSIPYPIANLKKDWYVSLVHLTQYYIFIFLIDSLQFFLKFCLQKLSQLVGKNMQDLLNTMYLAWRLTWPNPERGLHEHLVCLSLWW